MHFLFEKLNLLKTFVARNSYEITMIQLNGAQQVFHTQKAPWYGSCQNLNFMFANIGSRFNEIKPIFSWFATGNFSDWFLVYHQHPL